MLAWVLAACSFEHGLVPCGDLLCPRGSVCTSAGLCAGEDEAAACVDLVDGDRCMTAAIADGTCSGGACRAVACGNAIIDHDEVCDDGNQAFGDGCSSDCRSDETCGNGVPDVLLGEECDSGLDHVSGDGCASICTGEIDTWRDIAPVAITSRSSAGMAYDSGRNLLVQFGGLETIPNNETWEWDTYNWLRRRPATSPSARSGVAMAYDPERGEVVLFGGRDNASPSNTFYSDTWIWNGINWEQRMPATVPQGRSGAGIAFDPSRGVLVMFGGFGNGPLSDTWEWDGTNWTLANASTVGLDARSNMALAYDVTRAKVILHSALANVPETWDWNGVQWTRIATTGPSPRTGFTMVSDPPNNRVVLFGGATGLSHYNDTWVWTNANGGSWSQLTFSDDPPGMRASHAMAFHAGIGSVVVSGGKYVNTTLADTWALVSGIWTPYPGRIPSYRHEHLSVYDPLRGVTLFHGGAGFGNFTPRSDQWLFDGENWVYMPTSAIPARLGHAGAFDGARGNMVVFGGQASFQERSDTWIWDGSDWSPRAPSTSPEPRGWHSMAYDAARGTVVLFGGQGFNQAVSQYVVYGDTWLWDGTTWSKATPATSPPPRYRHVMAYDAVRERVVLHGGDDDTNILKDTWEWDGATWVPTNVPGTETATTAPAGRAFHAAAYDPLRAVVVAWGGQGSSGDLYDDTWEWDGTIWREATPLDRPTVRFMHQLAYDSIRRRLLMTAGTSLRAIGSEVWARSFDSPMTAQERCLFAGEDNDQDGLVSCADPDCFGRCAPLCPPGAACPPDAPRCGDGACGMVEDYLICPMDCSAP